MAIHYAQSGGGGFMDALLGAAAMFVPGLQPLAPYIYGAKALMNGDAGGAIGSFLSPAIGKALGSASAAGAAGAGGSESLFDALMNAHRANAQGADPWDDYRDRLARTEYMRRWR
ncbi:MAG: hypothetical protein LBF92_06455 [Synergistaceae bacterium]|jgi:hypothetical protein|nr:hypothetical protein [Synergistaceae bacterium]